jgi:hypothetical protein
MSRKKEQDEFFINKPTVTRIKRNSIDIPRQNDQRNKSSIILVSRFISLKKHLIKQNVKNLK